MSQPSILVAGGAGYIGAHFCKAAASAGFTPVVLDRLASASPRVEAFRRQSAAGYALEIADYGDEQAVRSIIQHHKPVAAVCFAALIEVAESMANPDLYWDNNFTKAARFFGVLEKAGVNKLVFSSTAAVYGIPKNNHALVESDALDPINPYGATKLGCEALLQAAQPSADFLNELKNRIPAAPSFPSLRSVAFRYFNAAGADGALGEMHEPETHLIPNALFAAEKMRNYANGQKTFTLFGRDYPTKDGTTVRDYVHVNDLAHAHILGLRYLLDGGKSDVLNLGTGQGYSVREVVETVRRVTKKDFAVTEGPRRAGDPPTLVADAAKASALLGWKPAHGLDDIVASAHQFHKAHG